MPDYTILLIDYEPRSIERLRSPLEAAGYRVEVARDGIIGAEKFHQLEPDLTLVEAMLPKKHGFDLCKELKSTPHGKRSTVIILTAVYKGRKYRSEATYKYGCDAYLEKPIDDGLLLSVVEHSLVANRAARAAAVEPAADEHSGLEADAVPSAEAPVKAVAAAPRGSPSESGTGELEVRIAAQTRDDNLLPFAAGRTEPDTVAGTSVGTVSVPSRGGAQPAVDQLPAAAPAPARRATAAPPPPRRRRGTLFLWIAFVLLVALGGAMFLLLL